MGGTGTVRGEVLPEVWAFFPELLGGAGRSGCPVLPGVVRSPERFAGGLGAPPLSLSLGRPVWGHTHL